MGLGKLVRYIESRLFIENLDLTSLRKNNQTVRYIEGLLIIIFVLFLFFNYDYFCCVTSRYLAFWDRSSLYWNEPATSPLGVDISAYRFKLHFRSLEIWSGVNIVIKPYKHFISFHVSFWASSELILTFTKWGGLAWETTFVHGPQCNFSPRSTNKAPTRYVMIFSYFVLLAKRLSNK